jgi:hypothetical protein
MLSRHFGQIFLAAVITAQTTISQIKTLLFRARVTPRLRIGVAGEDRLKAQ